MSNFLILELCDNDYGHDLKEALEELVLETENVQDHTVQTIKSFVIEHVIFQHKKWDILFRNCDFDEERSRSYLTNHLKVYWSEKFPLHYYEGRPVDHDGGSVCLNVAMSEVYLF